MTKRQMIDELLEQYRVKRQSALDEAARKRALIAQKAPIYQDLEQQLLQIFRQAQRTDPDRAKEAVYALQKEAQRQLAQAGYAPEDLQPKFQCPLCQDTGYVGYPVRSFCSCFEKKLYQMQLQQEELCIPADHTFDFYDLSVFPEENGQRAQMAQAKQWAEQTAREIASNRRRDAVLFGESGLGKTFLLDCILSRCVQNGCSAMKISAFTLNDVMRKKHMGQEEDRFALAQSVQVLGIDDLGTEPMLENVTVEYLFALICQRQTQGKSTLITTNLNTKEFRQRYSERIATRLHQKGNHIIQLKGVDVRVSR